MSNSVVDQCQKEPPGPSHSAEGRRRVPQATTASIMLIPFRWTFPLSLRNEPPFFLPLSTAPVSWIVPWLRAGLGARNSSSGALISIWAGGGVGLIRGGCRRLGDPATAEAGPLEEPGSGFSAAIFRADNSFSVSDKAWTFRAG